MGRVGTGAWIALVALSCADPARPDVEGVEPYDALPEYPAFWTATTACSDRSGDLDRISWFRAVSITFKGQIVRGFWEPPHTITVWNGLEPDEFTVRHEMLHDLLGGDPDHELSVWADCDLLPR